MKRGWPFVLMIVAIFTIILTSWIRLSAHPRRTYSWTESMAMELTYFKDERTKICYAYHGAHFDYGPYFTAVPCELVDKADWQYYERLEK